MSYKIIPKDDGFARFLVRIEEESYEDLRKLSHIARVPMAEIVRNSIKETIKENKRILTKTDIAI
jgi:hypothetical protein